MKTKLRSLQNYSEILEWYGRTVPLDNLEISIHILLSHLKLQVSD